MCGNGALLMMLSVAPCRGWTWVCSYYVFCYRSLSVRLRTALHLSSWFKRLVDWAVANQVQLE
jgi:hypothetical protein